MSFNKSRLRDLSKAYKTSHRRLLSQRAGSRVWVLPNGETAYYSICSRLEEKLLKALIT